MIRLSNCSRKISCVLALATLTVGSIGCNVNEAPQTGANTEAGGSAPATGSYCGSRSKWFKSIFDTIHHTCPHLKNATAQAAADIAVTGAVTAIEKAAHSLLHNAPLLARIPAFTPLLRAVPPAALIFETAKTFCAVAAAGGGAIE